MAESTSNAVPASPNGQDDRVDQRPGSRQAAPNWYDDPKFREIQSKKDREVNELRQQVTLAQQQIEYERQQRIRLEEANMDETERALRQVERERQEKLQWQQYAANIQAQKVEEDQKRKALQRIASKFEVSVDELWGASDAIEAAEIAHTKWLERQENQAKEREQQRLANKPDLMSGRPPAHTGDNQWQERLDHTRRQGDSKGFWDTFWEANKAGAEIR